MTKNIATPQDRRAHSVLAARQVRASRGPSKALCNGTGDLRYRIGCVQKRRGAAGRGARVLRQVHALRSLASSEGTTARVSVEIPSTSALPRRIHSPIIFSCHNIRTEVSSSYISPPEAESVGIQYINRPDISSRLDLHTTMFASQAVKALPDLTLDLSEPLDWQVGALKTVQYHLDVTAISTEPTSGLFAVGM